jgi:hypothetical protein
MKKSLLKRFKTTNNSREYNTIRKALWSYCGELYAKDYSDMVCECRNHRRYWSLRREKRILRTWKKDRSWKKYRKTQYKNLK